MPSFTRYSAIAASIITLAHALQGITVPSKVAANTSFQASFEDAGSDAYRVFLSASVTGANGPMCYLVNSTSLSSPANLTIPAAVGPSASYYSIGIADLTTSQDPTYSNKFNFTGGTGEPTEYEENLDGAPFWDASKLPCSAMSCARQCASASYPDDLKAGSAYETMKTCILDCPGVEEDETLDPADSSSSASSTATGTASATSATADSASASGTSTASSAAGAAVTAQAGLIAAAGAVAGFAALVL